MHPRAAELIEASRTKLREDDINARSAFRLACLTIDAVFEGDDERKRGHLDHLETAWAAFMESDSDDSLEGLFGDLDAALATIGLLEAHAATRQMPRVEANGRVFIVHGHDLELRDRVTAWVQGARKTPIVLSEQPGSSKTVIERNADCKHGFHAPHALGGYPPHKTPFTPRRPRNSILQRQAARIMRAHVHPEGDRIRVQPMWACGDRA